MTALEDRLRAALRADAPPPVDAESIMEGAQRRRNMVAARVGAAVVALVVVAGVALGLVSRSRGDQAPEPGAIVMSTPAAGAAEPQPGIRPSIPDIVPGRSLSVFPDRWCLVSSSDGRPFGCAPLKDHVQRVSDDQGVGWLVMLAASGPDTAVLQVEQTAAWVNLRTSPAPGSENRWVGVVPSTEAPEEPRASRALSAEGKEIWRA